MKRTMKNRTFWIAAAVIVNVLLLPFTFGFPQEAAAGSGGHIYDCCKESSRGGEYCCAECCWMPWGCGDKETCGDS